MALATILHITLLCVLVAAASDSMELSEILKMDPYDPEFYSRLDEYHYNRHAAARTLFSNVPAAMRTGAATATTMMSGEKAEIIIYLLVRRLIWALMKYSTYGFLLWCAIRIPPWRRILWDFGEWVRATAQNIAPQIRAGLRGWFDLFGLLPTHIFRAISQNRWVLHARWAIGDWFSRTRQAIIHMIDDIWHHHILDLVHMHYQLTVNWMGRHKLHVIVVIVAIHFFTPATSSHNNKTTEVFMKWNDLQRYIDTPLPAYLLRQRLESGSNSHYWPGLAEPIPAKLMPPMPVEELMASSACVCQTEIEQQTTGLAVEISTPPTTTPGLVGRISAAISPTVPLEVDAMPSTAEIYETEKRQQLPGGEVAYCRHCRQNHCCDVYI